MESKTTWTTSQLQRLKELGIHLQTTSQEFSDQKERDFTFQQIEKKHVRDERKKISSLLQSGGVAKMDRLKHSLTEVLCREGFLKVSTPTIISRKALSKMSIDQQHPLQKQIFWLDEKKCLRPMLAPSLYSIMRDFSRQPHRPVRFFEIGSCFRKESEGAQHASEFTMLNLVEMGIPRESRLTRITELFSLIASRSGIIDYSLDCEKSVVYGTTFDLIAGPDNVEIASAAMGPHPLDQRWEINENWVGMGFGLERLLMIANGDNSIGKWSKKLRFHDGLSLRI